MKITKETLHHVANVARIKLTTQEEEKFTKELHEILEVFSTINQIDTTNYEPAFHPIPINGTLREDSPKPSLHPEASLKNATHKEETYFKGPKIL